MSARVAPTTSPTTAAAQAFVAAHLTQAAALGESLAALVGEPDRFIAAIDGGFAGLADPAYIDGSRRIAPGLGEILGVRLPLMEAAHRTFTRASRQAAPGQLLDLLDGLMRHRCADVRWFGIWNLERLLPADPERSWELMRRAAHEAAEWITVDTLAHPYGAGILRDPRRWAELEELVFSPSRWERRLVGSTLATMPHVNLAGATDDAVVRSGLGLVGQLIGDAEPDVQKALSWALRTYATLDPAAVSIFLETEARTARGNRDGNRAWVIRDSISKLPDDEAARLRAGLEGIRRGSGSQSTSRASATAAEFASTRNATPPYHTATGRISAP